MSSLKYPPEASSSAFPGIPPDDFAHNAASRSEREGTFLNRYAVISLSEEEISKSWWVEFDEEEHIFVVRGEKIEKFARRTNFANIHGVNRLRDILRKMGIERELRSQGAQNSSVISIAGNEFELVDSSWEE